MELDQLRALVSVLDCGSFLSASQTLSISRSTLRLRVTALEKNLGLSLLKRDHSGVLATDDGLWVAERGRALLRDADAISALAGRDREEVIGSMHLRAPVGLPPGMLAVFVAEVRRRYTNISLSMEFTKDPSVDIPPGIDVVVHFGPAPKHGLFRIFTLARFPERLLASSAYLASRGRPETLEALSDHDLLAWQAPGEDGCRWSLHAGGSLQVSPVFLSSDPFLVRTLAAAGQGIALLPDAEVARGTAPGEQFEVVLPELVGREVALRIMIPEAKWSTARNKAVIKMIRELAQGLFGVTLSVE